jgi:phosphate starvation-inducible protein PhoH and related proteins
LKKECLTKNPSIILSDNNTIKELLGENDQNLKIIEELIGVDIFSQGNEIILGSDDALVFEKLKTLLNQLEEFVKSGKTICPDLIRTVFASIHNGEAEKTEFLKSTEVIIPRSLKKVFPRTYNQALYLDLIAKNDMVFGIGPAGTGKTFLAVSYALKDILSHTRKKLIITRPVVEAGESLGYLPGDLEQKIHPYLRPIYDAIEAIIPMDLIRRLEENGVIEIAPLAYMRGRTLADCFVILDEAQNTTKKQMMMFLTRLERGSKAVITGDITQADLPPAVDSGLVHVMKVLRSIDEIKFISFTNDDVVRNPLVKKIVMAYENIRENE